ncbi:MAG TPA: hypothetical protein VEZ12_13540 [Herpetosiphonaceae bacterium]|nr:hypothetical protein [Herpetosiphonaceae bacterium]
MSKLTVRWSKRERDLMIDYPAKCDGALMASALDELRPELEARGYDITTLRFSVARKTP